MISLVALALALLAGWVSEVSGHGCPDMQDCTMIVCASLPENCEEETGTCQCCPVCRLKEGEPCTFEGTLCGTGMGCADEKGEAPYGPWNEIAHFQGFCQNDADIEFVPLGQYVWK